MSNKINLSNKQIMYNSILAIILIYILILNGKLRITCNKYNILIYNIYKYKSLRNFQILLLIVF